MLLKIIIIMFLIVLIVILTLILIANIKGKYNNCSKDMERKKHIISEQLSQVYPDVNQLQDAYREKKVKILVDEDPITHERRYMNFTSHEHIGFIVMDKNDPLYGQKIYDLDDYRFQISMDFYKKHPEYRIYS